MTLRIRRLADIPPRMLADKVKSQCADELEEIKRNPIVKDRELRSYEKLENNFRAVHNCLIDNLIKKWRGNE